MPLTMSGIVPVVMGGHYAKGSMSSGMQSQHTR